jgi:hypothetical protein
MYTDYLRLLAAILRQVYATMHRRILCAANFSPKTTNLPWRLCRSREPEATDGVRDADTVSWHKSDRGNKTAAGCRKTQRGVAG